MRLFVFFAEILLLKSPKLDRFIEKKEVSFMIIQIEPTKSSGLRFEIFAGPESLENFTWERNLPYW